ncbi:MAG: hypothetical protein NTV05_17515 [Acidobacteria bacterium]|nr:hypothetical protein [Acidobacteriota bacterium]
MKYKGVTRIITILIQRSLPKGPYTLDVVPDYATALPGDTVAWNIQGAPAGVDVTVGNFEQVSGLTRVRVRRGAVRMVAQNFPEKKIKKTPTGHACKLRGLLPGIYKYDVRFNGVTVLDPEIEVPRPGRL